MPCEGCQRRRAKIASHFGAWREWLGLFPWLRGLKPISEAADGFGSLPADGKLYPLSDTQASMIAEVAYHQTGWPDAEAEEWKDIYRKLTGREPS